MSMFLNLDIGVSQVLKVKLDPIPNAAGMTEDESKCHAYIEENVSILGILTKEKAKCPHCPF